MKHSKTENRQNIRFLTIRAVVVILAVLGALFVLRWGGVTVAERDVPVQIVEEVSRATAPPSLSPE